MADATAAAGGGARKRMRPHTDAGFGALSDERGAYLPAERPSAASSAARLAATQQQRCRASTAPASQRRPRHPPSRARQGATVDARRLKAPRASHCSFLLPRSGRTPVSVTRGGARNVTAGTAVNPQQLPQRRRRRQQQQPPAASPLAARGGSQCEPPDPGRLGPRSAGGCRRFNLQQPTTGRTAKGAHCPKQALTACQPTGIGSPKVPVPHTTRQGLVAAAPRGGGNPGSQRGEYRAF